MPDYSKGKIYRLVGGGLTYYGSTVNELRYRLKQHKNDFKNRNITSSLLFETGDEVKIYLVEKYPCADRMELNARERYWIENNECVNNRIPTRTHKERYEVNKDKMKEYAKQYNEVNKDKKKEYMKEYSETHKNKKKEYMKQYMKEYREAHKEKIKQKKSEKITCECGVLVSKYNLSKHRTSKRHILSTTE